MAAHAPPEVAEGTLVFTDLVGFTEYTALQGDEDALALLARQDELVMAALPANARIVKELGDGLLLWFEDACQAIETVCALQRQFEHESLETDMPLWVRVGMHTGRPTKRGEDLVGHDVNLARRVVDVAAPGEILLSQATMDLAAGKLPDVHFEELGPVVMKGIPDPVPLYRARPEA